MNNIPDEFFDTLDLAEKAAEEAGNESEETLFLLEHAEPVELTDPEGQVFPTVSA